MRRAIRLWVGSLPFLLFLSAVSPVAACVGDCDANDEVTVDEVVTGVNIALGAIGVDVCERFDANGDNEVTVDEILRAVSAALDGCPSPGTATTTATSTPVDTPEITPTETPSPTASTPPASATPTEEPSVAPTSTPTPSAVATATASATPAPSDTPVPTASASPVANTPTATATQSPSLTPQPTASFTPTKTPTSTSTPTGTASPTPTFSATRTPTVTVTATHTPTVTALPTSTRTPTASPAVSATPRATATSTPTATPDPAFARRAAGTVVNSLDTFLALPSFLATLGSIPAFGIDTNGMAVPIDCPGGGTFTYSCGRQILPPPPGPPEFFLTFSSCILEGASGRTLTSDGSIAATGVAGQTCMTAGENLSVSVAALSLVSAGDTATTTVAIEDLVGNLTVTAEDPSCADTIASQLSGTVTTTTQTGDAMTSATVELASTSFDATFAACDASGTPTDYTMTVDGGVTFLVGDGTFATDFDTYGLDVTVGETSTQVTLAGSLTSGCLGGTATFATLTPLQRGTDAECPSSGVVAVTGASHNDRLTYAGGTVELDIGANGSTEETWPTCRAPQLYVCPE